MVLRFSVFMKTKRTHFKLSNILFVVLILLFIIPQTRTPIQVGLHQLLAKIMPVSIEEEGPQIDYEHWQLQGIDGSKIDFENLKEKVVIINFWATWCPPCIAEMQSLDELYTAYQDDNDFIFLYISNETEETLRRFINNKDYNFEAFKAMSSIPNVFETTSIPRTLIIDKAGRIVVDKSGASDWNSETIHNLLKKLKES